MYCYAHCWRLFSVTAKGASLLCVLQMEVKVHLCAYVHVHVHVTEKERQREQIVKEMSGWHRLASSTVSD